MALSLCQALPANSSILDAGYILFNARWYDATLGRFIHEDPIRYGNNWYAYCSNNPLTNIDPTGLADENGQITQEEAVRRTKTLEILKSGNRDLFKNWQAHWTVIAESNQKKMTELEEKYKAEDASLFGHNFNSYNQGDKGALGAEYQQAAGDYDESQAQLRFAGDVLTWVENEATAGRMPTYDQITKYANDNAIATGIFADIFLGFLAVNAYMQGKPGNSNSRIYDEIDNSANTSRNAGKYIANRKLPRTKHGDPMPDSQNPHTQLGQQTRNGETFNQAQEWMYDANGRLTATRRIDFSDHQSTNIHPNPHQHVLIPNNPNTAPQGGYIPGPPEPLYYPLK